VQLIDPKYRKQIEQIVLDNEDYVDEGMKTVYSNQKDALNDVHNFIGALFIAYAIDGLIKVNSSQKAIITSNTNKKLKTIGKSLGQNEVEKITSILKSTYQESYYKNAYILDSGMKIKLKFDILSQKFIDAAVNSKYKDELFSDRIWKNKADMIDKLSNSLTDAMKGDTTIDKIGRDIKNTFNVAAYESQRLVNTENARVQTQASYDIGISTGVKQVMWSATLDGKTADEDASLDGKIWDIDEDHPEPPLHPSCRCCLINVPYEGWTPTQRKDNETKDIIDYKNYDQWLVDKGI